MDVFSYAGKSSQNFFLACLPTFFKSRLFCTQLLELTSTIVAIQHGFRSFATRSHRTGQCKASLEVPFEHPALWKVLSSVCSGNKIVMDRFADPELLALEEALFCFSDTSLCEKAVQTAEHQELPHSFRLLLHCKEPCEILRFQVHSYCLLSVPYYFQPAILICYQGFASTWGLTLYPKLELPYYYTITIYLFKDTEGTVLLFWVT